MDTKRTPSGIVLARLVLPDSARDGMGFAIGVGRGNILRILCTEGVSFTVGSDDEQNLRSWGLTRAELLDVAANFPDGAVIPEELVRESKLHQFVWAFQGE